MKESILRNKSYAFALKIFALYKQLIHDHKEFILSKQVLKSGTALGALTWEAQYAQSTPDFISKMSIALKEANETDFWLSLLSDSGYLTTEDAITLRNDLHEIILMLASSVRTSKEKLVKQKALKKNKQSDSAN
jgi:four helix bundle protein